MSINALLTSLPTSLTQATDQLYHTPSDQLQQVADKALTTALKFAIQLPFYQQRIKDLDPSLIDSNPQAAIKHFGVLRKHDYITAYESLKQPVFDQLVRHRFFTSGTSTGHPTEMPWSEWEYAKGFVESSLYGLAMAEVNKGDTGICLASDTGALGLSYQQAANIAGVKLIFPDQTILLSSTAALQQLHQHIRQHQATFLIGAPGVLTSLTQKLAQLHLETQSLGITAIISGIGNFFTQQHQQVLVDAWNPIVMVEQAGKNEIHHSPGAIRYHRHQPQRVCTPGFVHYHPAGMFAFQSASQPNTSSPPVLLMSRLAGDRQGVVSYINDGEDFGWSRSISDLQKQPCPCGSNWPQFAYAGRVDGAPTTRFGLTLYAAAVTDALAQAGSVWKLPASALATLRGQLLLVRSNSTAPDSLYWLIGLDTQLYTPTQLRKLHQQIQTFPQFLHYYKAIASSSSSAHISLQQGYLVHADSLPHSGRDKPQYRLVQEFDNNLEFENYIQSKSV